MLLDLFLPLAFLISSRNRIFSPEGGSGGGGGGSGSGEHATSPRSRLITKCLKRLLSNNNTYATFCALDCARLTTLLLLLFKLDIILFRKKSFSGWQLLHRFRVGGSFDSVPHDRLM
jgi:hypothetical protein